MPFVGLGLMGLRRAGGFRILAWASFEASAFFLPAAGCLLGVFAPFAWLVEADGCGVCAWPVVADGGGTFAGVEIRSSAFSKSETTGSLAVPGTTNFPAANAAYSWWKRSPGRIGSPIGVTNGTVTGATELP